MNNSDIDDEFVITNTDTSEITEDERMVLEHCERMAMREDLYDWKDGFQEVDLDLNFEI